jgi:hypothetical protein
MRAMERLTRDQSHDEVDEPRSTANSAVKYAVESTLGQGRRGLQWAHARRFCCNYPAASVL